MDVFAILVCLFLSAFFSGMEIAFVSSNKIFIGIEKLQDSPSGRMLARISAYPARFIVALLLGNTVALVAYVYCMLPYLPALTEGWGLGRSGVTALLVQLALTTLPILLASEFLPKVFFRSYANQALKALALPAGVFYWMVSPLAGALLHLADFILVRVFRSRNRTDFPLFSRADLGAYISEQLDAEGEKAVDMEVQIFRNALEFSGIRARDIMTPRTEITAVSIDSSLEDLRNLFIATGYSKILVFRESLDDVVGYVHSFDMFRQPADIASVVISAEFAPGVTPIRDLLNQLTRKRRSVALVLDEHGGTAGMVTTEDIVEELFGEIEDEHDQGRRVEEEVGPHEWLFSARLEVRYLNDTYALHLPQHDAYTTLGGLVAYHTGSLPGRGDVLQVGDYALAIEDSTAHRIETVRVTLHVPQR
ncbi:MULTISPECIES: hemolysin family protein [unclassified Flavobacterium]|uniref:hemolysin family protein n=1 Tax=unclassified Flavobacterium TaxID=196869 RepID=UPI001F12BCD7|nr:MULTISPECIES: hemolysin family protein [unclassified Flavobacterium]UMY65944.1 hemolysin family protein [Flavobacterium sp. HJ-32-4]